MSPSKCPHQESNLGCRGHDAVLTTDKDAAAGVRRPPQHGCVPPTKVLRLEGLRIPQTLSMREKNPL